MEATRQVELLLVDIPIGLPETGAERACDLMARQLLGPRKSSVFPVPVRHAVYAPTYQEACDLNATATGRRPSLQCYAICRKIAQVDLVLRSDTSLQQRIREIHPEVCLAALNDWQPMQHKKKSAAGKAERLDVLARHCGNAHKAFLEARNLYRRHDVADDDIIDAMAAAVTAALASGSGVPSIPSNPPVDAAGLRMEMICPAIKP